MDIKKQRDRINLTQDDLSFETQIPRSRIAKWEADGILPKVNDYKILEKFFQNREDKIKSLYNVCINDVEPILLTLKSKIPAVGVPISNNPKFINIPFFVDVEKFKKWEQLCFELFSIIKIRKIPEINNSTTSVRFIHDILRDIPKDKKFTWIVNEDEITKTNIQSDAKLVEVSEFIKVPFISVHAIAGYASGYGDNEYINELPTIPIMVDRRFKGKYRIFEVDGDSMDNGGRNSLYDGDKILCREVIQELWTTKLNIKDWFFVIVFKNDGIVVKQIIEHNTENGNICCHSLNQIFEDFTVNLNDVVELYNVIKIVDRNTRV